jgi:hypothetical protein
MQIIETKSILPPEPNTKTCPQQQTSNPNHILQPQLVEEKRLSFTLIGRGPTPATNIQTEQEPKPSDHKTTVTQPRRNSLSLKF